jgi:hypothetical protein
MAKEKNPVDLRNWQEDLLQEIDAHEEYRNSEQYQGVADYAVNKALSITLCYPRGSGHTFLSSYIASKYPTLLVYGKTAHYKTLTSLFPLNAASNVISHYEIHYSMYKDTNASPELVEIQAMFANKKVVVVDNAMSVGHDVRDFILASAQGAVVFLGR